MSLWLSSLIAAAGATGAYGLIRHWQVSPIRASSGLTLVVAGAFYLIGPQMFPYSALFFGATFVGMTEHSRLGFKSVLMTSQLFLALYLLISVLTPGLGGSLGASAFISCCFTYEIAKRVNKKKS